MVSTIQLLGPPGLYPLDHSTDQGLSTSNDPSFIDVLMANYDKPLKRAKKVKRGRTENGSATFLSTGNPCLDFFFHIVPDTPPKRLISRLKLAWKYDPLTTLKLICNLRGVRGTGKSDKEGFYASALWLHKNHPKTLAGNVKWFADFGYFKDLPEILFRLLEGLDVRKKAKEERPKPMKKGKGCSKKGWNSGRMKRMRIGMVVDDEKKKDEETVDAKKSKKEKNIEKGKKALEMYCNDEDYRFLHDQISDMFAEYLISDLKLLNSGEVKKISLASKWCPNLGSSFDRATLLCESIARRVFPREKYPEYEGIEDAHYAYRVRDRLRKQYLVPLHQALEITEVYICSKRWDLLPYNRVPSVAMKNYKSFFYEHDEERFKQYLEKVKSGKTTIAAGALLPHEIIESLEDVSEDDEYEDKNDVAELQWRRMVKDLTEKGKLRDCLAICDVSGSMEGTPMEVCVALGLLISEMSEDPWKGKLITFSRKPQLHKIEGEDLYSKIQSVKRMDWGMNTNFQKVFDLILGVAIKGKLKEENMIKRVFVFSDMEFDEASGNSWETDYKAIKRKFRASGFRARSVPQIVFWNLRDSKSTPVIGEQKGVALVSGFSKNMLSLFLEGVDPDQLGPQYVMEKAISGRNPVDYSRPAGEVNLVEWLKTMVGNRKSEDVVDPKLPEMPSSKALKRVLLVALRCVDPDAQKRPKMGHVIHMLEADDLLFCDERRVGREPSHSRRDYQQENHLVDVRLGDKKLAEPVTSTSEGESSSSNQPQQMKWR